MGNESLIEDIARLLPRCAATAAAIRLEPCGGGGNNRVFAFDADGRRFVAKCYFNHPTDERDRLGAEYAFLRYAEQAEVSCVPRPVARDPERHFAIYERVPGRRLDPAEIGTAEVTQAIAFFVALNRAKHRALAKQLPAASEAGFSVAQHFAVVDRRISRLQAIPGDTEIDAAARRYVATLCATWVEIKRKILERLAAAGEAPDADVVEHCVSPSDFGFHNALMGDDGHIRFIDFEYAGWDDPAKMAGDFFCQPAVPVSMLHYDRFLEAAMGFSTHAAALIVRARLLLPVFQIKWCCIMLNAFLPDAARRRRFADPAIDPESRKQEQLGKAQRLLDSIVQ